MVVVVKFDDDEVRQYSGKTRSDCLAQAEKRCQKMDTSICGVIDCENGDCGDF